MNNLLKKLKYKKILKNYTKKNFLKIKKKNIYFGIDPTSSSLHLGHLLGIKIINDFYKLGFKKIIIVLGGITSLIGDINYYRKIKSNKKKIKKNIKSLKKQILKLFDNKNIIILNNKLWLKKIKLIYFIFKIFNKISFNNILKNKIIKNFILKNKNIKFTKIIYHIIQAYDYYYLYKKYKCNLQIGGSDQWTNILTGIKLIKKIKKKNVNGLTYSLLLNNKGIKFSKSNKNINIIWLNKKKTSILDFYQYFINLSDKIAIDYFQKFLDYKKKNNDKIIKKHKKEKKKKYIQKILSKFFLLWVYSKKDYYNILKITNLFFKNKNYKNIINKFLLLKKYLPIIKIYIKKKKNNLTIYDLIKKNKIIFFSNTNYKNFIKNNGLFLINGIKINNNIITNYKNLLHNNYLILQKGKKKFYLLKIILSKKNE
ncbi:MAG: tyrosine--tRNA ligase [Candidatus Shikimatogenerans sp. JK-2022]|nr:tyrosine--tRNA ligase [Candidatus Shikimatogenerans bostrichidophilus]